MQIEASALLRQGLQQETPVEQRDEMTPYIALGVDLLVNRDRLRVVPDRDIQFKSGNFANAVLGEFLETDDPTRDMPPPIKLILTPNEQRSERIINQQIDVHHGRQPTDEKKKLLVESFARIAYEQIQIIDRSKKPLLIRDF
jgi:hypothetical protein